MNEVKPAEAKFFDNPAENGIIDVVAYKVDKFGILYIAVKTLALLV